jgi:hypothetical protein
MKTTILTLLAPALFALVCAPLQAAITTELTVSDGPDSVTLFWTTTEVFTNIDPLGCIGFCEASTGTDTILAAGGASHGTFTFVGTVGSFSFNETTGRGGGVEVLPSLMNTESIDAIATGAGVLTTTFTDTDYSDLGSTLNLSASDTFTANTPDGSTDNFSGYSSAGNAIPAGTLIGNLATFTQTSAPSAQSNSATQNYANTTGSSGSLSEVVTLNFTGAGEIDSGFTIANVAVPEPASVVFLGSILLGLTALVRKRQARRS